MSEANNVMEIKEESSGSTFIVHFYMKSMIPVDLSGGLKKWIPDGDNVFPFDVEELGGYSNIDLRSLFRQAKSANLIELDPSNKPHPIRTVDCILVPEFMLLNTNTDKMNLVPWNPKRWRIGD